MLDAIRKNVTGWFMKILFGVLVASFALWGVGDILRVRPDTTVLEVGDREYSGQEFMRQFELQFRRLQQRFGPSLTRDQARQLGVVDQTAQQMTTRGLLDAAARDLGLTVSDEEILRNIRADPNFRNTVGEFDRFVFQQVLQSNNMTEAMYLEASRREMVRRQLIDSLVAGLAKPNALSQAYYAYQAEKRSIETLTIPNSSITEVEAPKEADVTKYYEDNKTSYMTAELRKLTFATLSPEDLLDEISVSEDDIRDEYESRRSEFVVRESRDVEQLLAGDKAKAEDAAKRLAAGEDFYKVSEAIANLKEDAVKLGRLTKDELPDEVRDAVFALSKDQISAPIEGPFGWVVYRVTNINPGKDPSFEDMRSRLERDLKLSRAGDVMFEIANKIEDSLAGGATLEETADNANLKTVTIDAVDGAGRDASGKSLTNLPKTREFLSTAFATEDGQEPVLTETETGSYFLLRVDSVTPPALKPLPEVRSQIVNAILAERRAKAAEELAVSLAARAGAGATFVGLAAGHKDWKIATSQPDVRGQIANSVDIDANLVAKLFNAKSSDVVTGSNKTKSAAVVARVVKVEAADVASGKDAVERLGDALVARMMDDALNQYREALRQEHPVTFDRSAVDALFGLQQEGQYQ